MSYRTPLDMDERPVAIVGAGTLGRQIATMYAAGGSEVRSSTCPRSSATRLDDMRASRRGNSEASSTSTRLVSGPSRQWRN
jgi:3-hydroxyacyl-CoA dehydrogenase